MSDQNLDYQAIRRSVEKNLSRQKWMYRFTFLAMHFIFFAATMIAVWGTVATDTQLREVLFNTESGASVVVILPTIMWAFVFLFHVASIYFESKAGEKAIRDQLLIREVGKDILRKGDESEAMLEKPKRLSSYDGELLSIDEDERIDQNDYNARTNHKS
jgi:hypothetical protein